MAAPTVTSVSPSSGPPGTAIAVTGSGFDAGARIGAPALVPTTVASAVRLEGEVARNLYGPPGSSLVISVWAQNGDGTACASGAPFTVQFAASQMTVWTDLDAVAGEVPGFKRGGRIKDSTIETWMRGAAQSCKGALRRRGIAADTGTWAEAEEAAAVLEHINRLGAAARLAAAVGGEFSQSEFGLAKVLQREYERELKTLQDGGYDRLFAAAAATVETGTQVAASDIESSGGDVERVFDKTQVF